MEIGYHLALDLFICAEKFKSQPRFFLSEGKSFKPISWKEYVDKVKKIAGFLISTNINTQDKVSILGQNSFNWCITHLGIQTVRGVMVPIYPASQPDLVEYFLDHSDSKILFCDSNFIKSISNIKLAQVEKIIVLDDIIPENKLSIEVTKFSDALSIGEKYLAQVEEKIKEVSNKDIATIIYTSGTTGLPKGVMLTHENLQSSSENWINLNSKYIPEHAVDLHWLPLSHTFGSGAIMLGNRLGWQSYMVNHKDLIEKIKEVKPHVFLSVPAYWEKLYNLMQSCGTDMKEAFATITGGRLIFGLSGGAGLKKEIKQGYHDVGLTIIEGYGLTECSPTLTMNRMDSFNFDSVGLPYPNVDVKLAEDGEILAKGANIFLGYYKDEESTKNTFDENGWFKTGDIGRWIDKEGGFLQIIDRKKEILVTSGGKNVPPQNIERMFQDNTLINHFVVYGDGKKYLTALITINEDEAKKQLNKDVSLDSPELKNLVKSQVEEVNKKLASYESIKDFWICPKQLSVEDNLLTSSLKIRRKAIYERYKNELESLYK
ncbi:MAG: long-chain fatty acid--CoA ligase [Candidatus Sericytochromatia bacterium]